MAAPRGLARHADRVAAVVRQAGRRQQVRVPADGQVAGQLPAEHARVEPARPAPQPSSAAEVLRAAEKGHCWLQALFDPRSMSADAAELAA